MQDKLLLAVAAFLLIGESRKRRRRYKSCIKCNQNAVLRPPRSGSESSSDETDGSDTDGECDCESSTLYTDEESEERDSETSPTERARESTEPTAADPAIPPHVNENVIVRQSRAETEQTMRRYPATQDAAFKYSVRDGNAAQPCPPAGTGDSYGRHMAEIEYWVRTHRPPCTYGMEPPCSQTDEPQKPVAEIQADAIKRPIDPDASPKNPRKKLFVEDQPARKRFFTTSEDKKGENGTNGSMVNIKTAAANVTANGDVSSERAKSRGRPTSTPITNRTKNVDAGKKASSVADDPPRTRSGSKGSKPMPAKRDGPLLDSPESAGPSGKPEIVEDSDTSILTAPYIRSTRNSASKTKCQNLSRQRASGKAKSIAKRSITKVDSSAEKTNLDTSLDTKESSAANASKFTSDSSLDIFTPDLTKESNSRRNTLRGSSVKKLPTLDFSGTKILATKRASEPVVTRNSAKRALLSNSRLGNSVANEENGFAERVGSAPVSRNGGSKRGDKALDGDEGVPSRRKFFF